MMLLKAIYLVASLVADPLDADEGGAGPVQAPLVPLPAPVQVVPEHGGAGSWRRRHPELGEGGPAAQQVGQVEHDGRYPVTHPLALAPHIRRHQSLSDITNSNVTNQPTTSLTLSNAS